MGGGDLAPAAETRLQRLQRQRQRRNNNINNARPAAATVAVAATASVLDDTNRSHAKNIMKSKTTDFGDSSLNHVHGNAAAAGGTALLSASPSLSTTAPPPPPPPITVNTSPKSHAVSVSIAESRRRCRSPPSLPDSISPSPPPAFPKLNELSSPNNNNLGSTPKNDYQRSNNKQISQENNYFYSSPSNGGGKIRNIQTMESQSLLNYRNGEHDIVCTPQRSNTTTTTTTTSSSSSSSMVERSNDSMLINNFVTPRKKLISQSSFLSQASMPSDEGTPNYNNISNNKNGITFSKDNGNSASNRIGGGDDSCSGNNERNIWKDMPRRTNTTTTTTTHNAYLQNVNSSNKKKQSPAEFFPLSPKTSNFTDDKSRNIQSTMQSNWSKRSNESPATTSPSKDMYSPSRMASPSNGSTVRANYSNNTKPISVRQQVNLKFTKKNGVPSPVSIVKRSPNHHQYKGHGGTPIWIHASLLKNDVVNKSLDGNDAWEWVRGYLLPANVTSDDSITITVDDPDTTLSNLNGFSFIIPKRYMDGSHILMGNAWWSSSLSSSSSSEISSSSALSPSPTSITQSLDGSHHPNTTTAAGPPKLTRTSMPPQDLAQLTHLHEPAIVHALRSRYRNDMIYTYTGNILLALNPFKMLNHLYTHEMMELFWGENSIDDDDNGGGGVGDNDNTDGGSSSAIGLDNVGQREGRRDCNDSPPPHAYAVAERAYSSMLHCLKNRYGSSNTVMYCNSSDRSLKNQTILVSGESGAGKTVTTKIIMRYLSILSQRHSNGINHHRHGRPGVEMQVLQSNPVLESFGNARTIRNDNSSRFGKFIEMSFRARKNTRSPLKGGGGGEGHCGSLLGATIDVYLLEKVRLVSVNPGERNYHIFYELLSPRGMNVKEMQRYKLTSHFGKGKAPLSVKDFNMTSISGTFDRRDGVDDSDTYQELRTAMNTVGFSHEEQDGIFAVVAALLHASNLQFVNDGGDKCHVNDRDGTSDAVSNLLGVSEESLKLAFTTSIIEARGELLVKNLSTSQADKALEATVKAIYGALFAYIVARINKSIEVQGDFRNISGSKDVATISVLDIFGFESFEINSFEQLCINYCNEALQQQFNRFVFKAEQAEYEREGIKWSNIDFPDNQEALDLIEAKRSGIFAVLDEQCRLPRRTDETFAKAVYETCGSNTSYFAASQMQMSKGRFVIVHYAGEVEYCSEGFILKNKDELPKSASNLLAASTVPLISELATIIKSYDGSAKHSSGACDPASLKRSCSTLSRPTVSGQFSVQLKDLRSRIDATEPHYIRCLKPNNQLVADHFDESLVAHQLNCAGVLPAMKIARAGFAMRYPHASFIQRYRPIVFQDASLRTRSVGGRRLTCPLLISLLATSLENEMRQTEIGNVADIVSWGVQVGTSKVFMRTTAFESLEKMRNSSLNQAATILQARTRAFLCQNKFYLILGSILTVQCSARKLLACLYVRRLRLNTRSIIIQKKWRSYFAWIRYQNILFISTWCQRFYRGTKVRKQYVRLREHRSAVTIQSAWRSYAFYQCRLHLNCAAIVIQCFYRTRVSIQALKQLKREAKDIKSISMERDKLRLEMRKIKQQLDFVQGMYSGNTLDHSDSWTTTDKTAASQEETIRLLSKECSKKDQELRRLRQEIDALRRSMGEVSLPLSVTLPSRNPTVLSPLGESSLNKSKTFSHTSQSLLDSECEDLPQLEYSQVSLPDSSMEFTLGAENASAVDQAIESSFAHDISLGEIPFHHAVLSGDKHRLLEEIQNTSCIELGINSADSKGRSPLHIAVQCSNLELVKILLSHDAIANTQDFSGNTALHYADTPEMTQILLEGGVSPNIPNGAGLCSLHLAVKRRDFMSVKHLLSHGADVNNADDACWYTPLHLVAHLDELQTNNTTPSFRGPIAELLCEAKHPSLPDLNYQDKNGNSPLHHAVSLVEEDAGILISLFIEHGSSPKIANNRGQTPIHIYCNNHIARQFDFYHEALHLMLAKGADPNTVSLSGCTALHLALYHRDMEAAVLLVRFGAQINMTWKKPQKWVTFWTDMGSDDVLPLDMLEDLPSLHRLLSEISKPAIPAPHRLRCMHCKTKFGLFSRRHNCTHCGRSVCGKCCIGTIHQHYFPTLNNEARGGGLLLKVCSLCEPILLSKMDRVPISIVGGGCDQSSLGTISM